MFRELRLDLEYGDYLAVRCERYKREDMNGLEWKLHPEMQWPDVDRELAKEDESLEQYRREGGRETGDPYPETPWLNSVAKAAMIAKMDPSAVRFEIHHYAKRNNLVYSEVKKMINHAQFEALGRQIVAGKRILKEMSGDNTRMVVEYRLAIGHLENEWFKSACWLDQDGVFHINMNERAIAKIQSFF